MHNKSYMFCIRRSYENPHFSDARNTLRAVLDLVVEDADVTVIARRDAPDAVVMSFDH